MTAFANSLTTPEHADVVRRLRDGALVLDGLTIDTDLSWQLLVGLATVGAVDGAAIDAALAADNTAKGAEFAAQARAALPTPEAKQAAWSSLVDHDDLSNTIVRSAALGFTHPAGAALLEAFVPQYFDRLLSIWDSRTFQVANYLIVGPVPEVPRERGAARRDPRMAVREPGRRAGPAPSGLREPRRCRACAGRAGPRRRVARGAAPVLIVARRRADGPDGVIRPARPRSC